MRSISKLDNFNYSELILRGILSIAQLACRLPKLVMQIKIGSLKFGEYQKSAEVYILNKNPFHKFIILIYVYVRRSKYKFFI